MPEVMNSARDVRHMRQRPVTRDTAPQTRKEHAVCPECIVTAAQALAGAAAPAGALIAFVAAATKRRTKARAAVPHPKPKGEEDESAENRISN
jgi:hypothetical protein